MVVAWTKSAYFIRPFSAYSPEADPIRDDPSDPKTNFRNKMDGRRRTADLSGGRGIFVAEKGGRKGKMATVTELVAALTQSQSHQQVRLSAELNSPSKRGEGGGPTAAGETNAGHTDEGKKPPTTHELRVRRREVGESTGGGNLSVPDPPSQRSPESPRSRRSLKRERHQSLFRGTVWRVLCVCTLTHDP